MTYTLVLAALLFSSFCFHAPRDVSSAVSTHSGGERKHIENSPVPTAITASGSASKGAQRHMYHLHQSQPTTVRGDMQKS